MKIDKRYHFICDICGVVKRRAFDAFSISDKERGVGICKSCAARLFPPEDDFEDDVAYFADTSPAVKPKKPEKVEVIPLDQVDLLGGI